MPVELPDIVVSSRTQSAETIARLLKEQGYETTDYELGTTSDGPPPEAPPPVEAPKPEVAAPPVEEIPAGEPVAGEAEEAEEPEPAEVPEPPAPTGERKNVPGSVRNKLKLQAKEQEIVDLKARLEALEKRPAASAPAPAPAAEVKPPEPEPELRAKPVWADFESSDDQLAAFTEAVGEWTVDKREFQKDKERREKDRTEAPAREAAANAEAEQRKVNEEFGSQVTAVKQEHPTFDQEVSAIPPTKPMVDVFTRQPDGAKLALWLARNPDDLAQVVEATRVTEASTKAEIDAAYSRAIQEVGKVRYLLNREGMPEGPTSRETPPPAPSTQVILPVVIPPVAAAPPAAPAAPVKAKPTPATPVGSRGATSVKTLSQMTESEVRNLSADEYRRKWEKGER